MIMKHTKHEIYMFHVVGLKSDEMEWKCNSNSENIKNVPVYKCIQAEAT